MNGCILALVCWPDMTEELNVDHFKSGDVEAKGGKIDRVDPHDAA